MGRRGQLIIEFLHAGYGVRFRVQGTSMVPTILPGSLILVRPAEPETLVRGELVLCLVGERLIAHRIVGLWECPLRGRQVLLRGDNRSTCDRMIAASAVLGRITALEEVWRWALFHVTRLCTDTP